MAEDTRTNAQIISDTLQARGRRGPHYVANYGVTGDEIAAALAAAGRLRDDALIRKAIAALEAAPRYQDLVPVVHASRVDQVIRMLSGQES